MRDWVIRYNEHGLDGHSDRWGDGRPPKLTCEERAELLGIVLAGPDPETSGPMRASSWKNRRMRFLYVC